MKMYSIFGGLLHKKNINFIEQMHLFHPIVTVLISKYVVQLRKVAVYAIVIWSKAKEFTHTWMATMMETDEYVNSAWLMSYILICNLLLSCRMLGMLFCYDLQVRTPNHSSAILVARFLIMSFRYALPPPLGAGGIVFPGCPSIRPSVRSPKYPLSTCTWIRWSIRQTVTVLRPVRPSR